MKSDLVEEMVGRASGDGNGEKQMFSRNV